MSKKNENKIAFKEINLLPSLEGLVGLEVEVPAQVLPVAIACLSEAIVTALKLSETNWVKVISELLKALVILQVITALFSAVVAVGIVQVAVGLVGAENVGVHVVADSVAVVTVPVTVNEYSLLAQLPSVLFTYVKVFNGQVLPVAMVLLSPLKLTSLKPTAVNLVKVIAELLKALLIEQVMVPLPPFSATAGIEQVTVGSVGAENVGVHVVAPDVRAATVPVTVNEYLLSAQLPSVLLAYLKVFNPAQLWPVAISPLFSAERSTAVNPGAVKPVKEIADSLKALVILQVITALLGSVVAVGIVQVAVGLVGAENVGVHVVADSVAVVTVPVTVKV